LNAAMFFSFGEQGFSLDPVADPLASSGII